MFGETLRTRPLGAMALLGAALFGVGIPAAALAQQADAGQGQMGPPAPAPQDGVGDAELPLAAADGPDASAAFNPELTALVGEAVGRHPAIAAQRAALRAAGVDVTAAQLTRLPTMSIQANQYGAIALDRTVSASVDLPLWTNGRIHATVDRARAARQVQFYRLAESVLDIELQVNQYYHDAKRNAAREDVLVRTLETMTGMVASMERRVNQQVSPQSDLQLASTRRLQVRQQLDLTRAQKEASLSRLRELVLRDDVALSRDFISPPAWPRWTPGPLVEQVIAASPQRLRTVAEARMANDDARISAAARLPGLYGSYSYDEVYKHRVGVSFRMQTAGGFSELFAARAARLRTEASDLQVPAVEQDLKATTNADLVEYDSAIMRSADAQTLARASQKITESYVRQFVSGRRTWLDVMNAVREAMSAELDAIDVQYAASASAMRILLRAGDMQPQPQSQTSSKGRSH